jgi:hypothetical protein
MLLSDSFYKNLYNTDDNDKLSKKKLAATEVEKVCVYFENMKELLFFS